MNLILFLLELTNYEFLLQTISLGYFIFHIGELQSNRTMSVQIYGARRQDSKNRQNSIDDLSLEIKQEWRARQLENWKRAYEDYSWALKNGIAKECARFVLPMGTSTRLYMSGNIRSWIHYIELRSANGTQLEHQEIALLIKEIFCKQFPTIAKALGWITEDYKS